MSFIRLSTHLSLVAALLAGAAIPVHVLAAPTALDNEVTDYLKPLPLTMATPEAVGARCDATLALAAKAETALEARTGKATIAGDFAAFDTLSLILSDGGSEMYLISETSPLKPVRDAAQACIPKLSDLGTRVSLSRPIYDRLAAIPTKGLDEKTGFTLNKMLTNYKLSGVDKDEATRVKVTQLQKEITETGLKFAENIRDDKGDIPLKPEEGPAAGLYRCPQAGRRWAGASDLRLSRYLPDSRLCRYPRDTPQGQLGFQQSRLAGQ